MDTKVALFFLLGSLVVGTVLFLPLWWLAKRLVRRLPKSEFTKNLLSLKVVHSMIFVAIVFWFLLAPKIFPESKIVSSRSFFDIGLGCFIVMWIFLQLIFEAWKYVEIKKFKKNINQAVSAYQIEPWTKLVFDGAISHENAYCVECHNDDDTKAEVIVCIMMRCFGLDEQSAAQVTYEMHAGKPSKIGRMSQEEALQLAEHIASQTTKFNFQLECAAVPLKRRGGLEFEATTDIGKDGGKMRFEFELTANDYVAVNSAAHTTKSVAKPLFNGAVMFALIFWIVMREFGDAKLYETFIFVGIATSGYLAYRLLTWRKKWEAKMRQAYEAKSFALVLGKHTLEFTEDGIVSEGPMHRSLRRWEVVTQVYVQQEYFWIATVFGVNYVLPKCAVSNVEEVETYLAKVRHIQLVR